MIAERGASLGASAHELSYIGSFGSGLDGIAARGCLAGLDRFGRRTPTLRQSQSVVREVAHLRTRHPVLTLDEDGGLEVTRRCGGISLDQRHEALTEAIFGREYTHVS